MISGKYKKEIKFIEDTLKEAVKVLEGMNILDVHDKSKRDLVTNSDYTVEHKILTSIQTTFKKDQILSEETAPNTKIEGRTWVLDPIDGTCNYANHIPIYGIQLALIDHKEIAAAGIALPCLNEIYLAVINEGCTLNGHSLKVSRDTINHSIVSFGDFNEFKVYESDLQSQTMYRLRHQIMKEKMFGAASVDFAFLASGRISGTYLIASHLWEILPGILICQEAGVKISDEKGEAYQLDSKIVMGANSQELLDLMCWKEDLC